MSEKKCKTCGAKAEWELDGECFCEFCACTEFDVQYLGVPCRCEMCGDCLDRGYYTDVEGYVFCSTKCALEYNGACEIEQEEQEDGREEEQK